MAQPDRQRKTYHVQHKNAFLKKATERFSLKKAFLGSAQRRHMSCFFFLARSDLPTNRGWGDGKMLAGLDTGFTRCSAIPGFGRILHLYCLGTIVL